MAATTETTPTDRSHLQSLRYGLRSAHDAADLLTYSASPDIADAARLWRLEIEDVLGEVETQINELLR